MFKKLKIRTRLTIAFLGVAVFSIFIASYLSYRLAENEIAGQVVNELVLVSGMKSRAIDVFFQQLEGRAVDFASDGFIRDSAQKIIFGRGAEIVASLNEHLLVNKMPLDKNLHGIVIIDLNGRVIASTDEREIGADESGHSYFEIAKNLDYGQPHLSGAALSHHFGEKIPVMAVSAPLFDKEREIRLGVLVNYVKIESLNGVVSGNEFLEIGESSLFAEITIPFDVYIVSQDKLIITETRDPKEFLTQKADVEPVRRCALGEYFTGRYENYLGEPVIGASACLKNGWTILAEISEKTAFRGLADIRRIILAVSIFIIGGLFVAVYFLVAGITRPITDLALAADTIGRGYLDFRAQKKTDDEIGELADAFNNMAAELKKSYSQLEERVKERTSDLEKFRLAVENSTNHVVITDSEGMVIYANKAAEKITGFSVKEMLGKKAGTQWGKLMDREYYENMWSIIKNQKKVFSGEISNRRKNGEKYEAAITIIPLIDEKGAIRFFVGVERDITEEKRIDRAKTEFVSLASHQLRTPLAAISWYGEMLLEKKTGKLTPKQKRYLGEIYRANRRMIDLVSALLSVSRIEMGTLAVEPKPTDIAAISRSAIKELFQEIKKKKIQIEENYEKLPLVSIDPNLTRVVFQNLVSNAVKYTPAGGRVAVEIKSGPSGILVKISDTGIGIPKYQQSKVFEKLFRADNARLIDPDGSGLGLYIVKWLVERSGGKIRFESEENKGTTFFVSIPLPDADNKGGGKKPG